MVVVVVRIYMDFFRQELEQEDREDHQQRSQNTGYSLESRRRAMEGHKAM